MPQEKPQPEAFSLYASVTQTTCNLFTRFEKLEPNSFPIKEMKMPSSRRGLNPAEELMVPWFKTTTKNNVHEFNTR